MKRIKVSAIGTYTAWTDKENDGPHAHAMRGLIWYVKNNRPAGTLKDTFWQTHPDHPSGKRIAVASPNAARDYSTDVLENAIRPNAPEVVLVPIPSSKSTAPNVRRWPARELARRLEARGFGTMRISLIFERETEESKGRLGKTADLVENLRIHRAISSDERVVFVDDVVTSGEHLAAAHHVLDLGSPGRALAVAISQGPGEDPRDAYILRNETVEYEQDRRGAWSVSLRPTPPTPRRRGS